MVGGGGTVALEELVLFVPKRTCDALAVAAFERYVPLLTDSLQTQLA